MKYLQGGDNDLNRSLYKIALDFIPKNSDVLNLGCGIKFNFEKLLFSEKEIQCTSVDIIDLQKHHIRTPNFIKKYVLGDVEYNLNLGNKYDIVCFFELIEHVDKTDNLLKNCFEHLKKEGLLIFSFPNLSSIFARIELLLGFQPHILEVSNEKANLGSGFFGRINNPPGQVLHHIRGITTKAIIDLLKVHGFEIVKIVGYDYRLPIIPRYLPKISPVNIVICKKKQY